MSRSWNGNLFAWGVALVLTGGWLKFVALARGDEGGAATQPSATLVEIDNFNFKPRELTIAAGSTVTWVNRDDVPHTATGVGDPPAFDSKALDTDDKFSFTFSKPGTYSYYCKVHPHMTGTIVVK